MKTQLTPTGWIETVVTTHTIKICKAFMTVENWNKYNLKNPNQPSRRFSCNRCNTFWNSIPGEQSVNLCMMEKQINQCICDTCKSEIDQSLIIK